MAEMHAAAALSIRLDGFLVVIVTLFFWGTAVGVVTAVEPARCAALCFWFSFCFAWVMDGLSFNCARWAVVVLLA